MNRTALLFLLIASIFASCEKEIISDCNYSTDGSPPTFYLDSSIKRCSFFLKNSYWIYQNNIGELDTMEVIYTYSYIGSSQFTCNNKTIVKNYEEHARMDVTSSYYNVTFMDLVSTVPQDNWFLRTELIRLRLINNLIISYFQDEQQILFEREDIVDYSTLPEPSDKQVEVLENFIFQDTTFSKVYKMSNVDDFFYQDEPSDDSFDMYFVEGIGMIKRTNSKTKEDWELIDYLVFQ